MSTASNKTLQRPPTHKEAKHLIAYKGEHPVDARLRILRDNILPKVPYILSTVTSLTPEHVKTQYPQNDNNWRKYTHFCRGEDELQYVTFKDRSDDHDIRGMYARGGWDDGKGKIAPPEEPYSRTSSDGTPRQGQASKKKKITLADYKNRDKNKAPHSAATSTVPKLKEGTKGDNKSVDYAANIKDVAKTHQSELHGQKRYAYGKFADDATSKPTFSRSADTMTGAEDPQSITHPPSSPPAKRARITPEPSTASSKGRPELKPQGLKAEAAAAKLKADGHKKPSHEAKVAKSKPRTTSDRDLSTTPVTQPSKSSMSRLPPMLSPLSSEIEEELAKMNSTVSGGRLATAKSNTSLDSNSIKTFKADRATAPTVGKAMNPTSAGKSSGIARLSKSTTSTKGPQEQREATAASHHAVRDVALTNAPTPRTVQNGLSDSNKGTSSPTPKTTPDAPKRMRLRIIIPIKKKANKKNLANYLRMKPTPGRNSLFPGLPLEQQDPRSTISTSEVRSTDKITPRGDSKPGRSAGSKAEIKTEAPKTGDKRGRARVDEEGGEDGPSSKRKPTGRAAQTQTPKPNTPKPPPTSSPALSHLGSAQRPPTSTPKAEINGTAMLRAGSGQGSVHTPQPPLGDGTPTAPDTGRRRRSYTSPDKPRSPKSEDLRAESSKYLKTATTLKHDADFFFKNRKGMSEDERKRAVVIGAESVLCFMVAFVLMDTQRSYSNRIAWNSILPYLATLQEAADKFKHISGLLHQLEGVIRDQVAYVDMQLLDKHSLKSDFGNPAADPGKTIEQHKAQEYYKHCHDFHDHFMKAQGAWRSGWMNLDVLDLQEQYSKTWARRDERRLAYGKGRDAVFKDQYVRGYNLPMGNMTSGLEAVNFGFNLIAEWSQAAGVEWKPKLVLSG